MEGFKDVSFDVLIYHFALGHDAIRLFCCVTYCFHAQTFLFHISAAVTNFVGA
jgi:hypothetical protein